MFSKFLILAATLVASVSNTVNSIKSDPNLGSNWYVPASTSAPLKSSGFENTAPSYNYNTVFNNGQSGQSSFLPTTNLLGVNQASGAVEDNSKPSYYNLQQALSTIDSPTGKQYQYLQYNPDGNAFHIYPVPTPGLAEQRQEFLNPNINGLLPLGGDGGPDGDGNPVVNLLGGGSIFDNLPSVGGITSGITGTASNIAQSIGLGSLGVLGSILVLAIGGPLIVFAILFPAAILIIAILGFPVLQLTLPASDPNLGRKLKARVMDTAWRAKEILQSEECVERFSCELARKSRKLPYENWILEKMGNVTNVWANRVSKSVKIGRAGENCHRFNCSTVTKMKNMYDALTSSTAKIIRQL